MDVLEAVSSRYSCRAFLPTPIPEKVVREIVERAARAPSAGNMQPWRVYAIAGKRVDELRALLVPRMTTELPKGEGTDYTIYPEPLTEPYRWANCSISQLKCRGKTSRRAIGSMRATINFSARRLPCFSLAKKLMDPHNGPTLAAISRLLPCWHADTASTRVPSRRGSLSTAPCVSF